MHEPSPAYAIQVEQTAVRVSTSGGACQRSRISVAPDPATADRAPRQPIAIAEASCRSMCTAADDALQRQALMTVDLNDGMDVFPTPGWNDTRTETAWPPLIWIRYRPTCRLRSKRPTETGAANEGRFT